MEMVDGVNELARRLNKSRTTIYRMVEKGLPHGTRSGKKRFDLDKVLQWLTTDEEYTPSQERVAEMQDRLGGLFS